MELYVTVSFWINVVYSTLVFLLLLLNKNYPVVEKRGPGHFAFKLVVALGCIAWSGYLLYFQ